MLATPPTDETPTSCRCPYPVKLFYNILLTWLKIHTQAAARFILGPKLGAAFSGRGREPLPISYIGGLGMATPDAITQRSCNTRKNVCTTFVLHLYCSCTCAVADRLRKSCAQKSHNHLVVVEKLRVETGCHVAML